MAPPNVATDSDKNRCNSCGHRWFPAGVDRASACPRCGSDDLSYSWTERYPAYAGCAAIIAFVAIVGWNAVRIGMAWWGHR